MTTPMMAGLLAVVGCHCRPVNICQGVGLQCTWDRSPVVSKKGRGSGRARVTFMHV